MPGVIFPTTKKWKRKGLGMFLCSAVSSPLYRSKRFTLHPPGRPVHSNTNLTSLGSIQPCCNSARTLFTHIFTAVYSHVLIYSADWTGVSWRERKYRSFETAARGIRTRPSRLSLAFWLVLTDLKLVICESSSASMTIQWLKHTCQLLQYQITTIWCPLGSCSLFLTTAGRHWPTVWLQLQHLTRLLIFNIGHAAAYGHLKFSTWIDAVQCQIN